MPISLSCHVCRGTFHVDPAMAGKHVRCPHCGTGFLPVPASPPGPSPGDGWQLKTPDGQLYGPTSKEELDRWMGEGRISAQCRILAAGQSQWQWAPAVYPRLVAATPVAHPPVAPVPCAPPPGGPAPYYTQQHVGGKSKIAAGILGILLGGWGVHRFYLGYVGIGIVQLVLWFATCGLSAVWGLIEGILILTGSIDRDADGNLLQD